MGKREIKLKALIFILVFFFTLVFFIVSIGPAIVVIQSRHEILGDTTCQIDELKNTSIVFPIKTLSTGKHDLMLYFVPYDSITSQQMQDSFKQKPINFELTVQVRHKNKLKEKLFTKRFTQENSRGIFYLFDVPDDFLWSSKANVEITIKDINFDEDFTHYFQKIIFHVYRYGLIAHKINIVDGELIERNNGFKNWE